MKREWFRSAAAAALLVISCAVVAAAQESVSKTQEQVARAQETAAKNQEMAARLAAEAAGDPASIALARDSAARARAAANRAQDAANRAQDAAERDAASSEAQAAAIRAQEAANRALESANRTQQLSNKMRGVGANAASTDVGATTRAADATERAASSGNDNSHAADRVDGRDRADGRDRTDGVAFKSATDKSATDMSPTVAVSSVTPSQAQAVAPAGAGGALSAAAGSAGGSGGAALTTRARGVLPQASGAGGPAVSTEAKNYSDYVNVRTEEIAIASLGPKNNTNQSETPSIGTNSTSLVEKSSVGDLVSFALNPAGTSGGSSVGDATSSSISITAYALKAFLSGTDPLDPAFYTANRRWRKFSFTYGYDFPEGEAGNQSERGNIYGLKFSPYDKRDVSDPSNRRSIQSISKGLQATGIGFANLVGEVRRYIFNRLKANNQLPATVLAVTTGERDQRLEFDRFLGDKGYADLVKLVGEDGLKEIDNIISKHTEFARFDRETEEMINRIRRRPQVSMFFLTKQRQRTRPDEYNGGLSLDLGLAERWNLTFNGTLSYTDNKFSADSRGGKFGTELLIPLTAMKRLADGPPATFSFAASGEWKTKVAPVYQGQAKLVIPVPFLPGLEMPLSVSFASRTELINESDVRGRVGFTFDVARLLAGLKAKFLANLPTPVP